MPPALHPRSGFTTSLFGTTLALSFLVVTLPHLIPCPVPRTPQFAEGQMEIVDADGRRYRRRLAPKQVVEASTRQEDVSRLEEEELRRNGRECPVPKPRGFIGQMLGFRQEEERVRPDVKIARDVRIAGMKDEQGGG